LDNNLVAFLDVPHAGPHGGDDSGGLMPGHERKRHVPPNAFDGLEICSAETARPDTDQGLAGTGPGRRPFFQLKPIKICQHCGQHKDLVQRAWWRECNLGRKLFSFWLTVTNPRLFCN
jgi:hypothetical protein